MIRGCISYFMFLKTEKSDISDMVTLIKIEFGGGGNRNLKINILN